MSTVIFFIGLCIGVIISIFELILSASGDSVKKQFWIIPFFLLVAAAVAKYLGM